MSETPITVTGVSAEKIAELEGLLVTAISIHDGHVYVELANAPDIVGQISLKVSDLADVDFSSAPTNLATLAWNSTENKWKPRRLTIRDMGDVTTEDVVNGSILSWDEAEQMWVTIPFPSVGGGVDLLAEMQDVYFNGFADGDVLRWSIEDGLWHNAPLVEGATTLDALTDVDVSSAPDGYILKKVDGVWIASSPESGPAGTPGSKWYSGTGAPANGSYMQGDWYLNDTNGDVYEKTGANAWTLRDNLTGPSGSAGTPGTPGTPGASGSKWYSGTGAPSNGANSVGDWYLNDSNGDVYEKTGVNAWTLRDNITGPTGPVGPGVPVGGTAGQVLTKNSGTNYDAGWATLSGGGGGATNLDALTDVQVTGTPADGAYLKYDAASGLFKPSTSGVIDVASTWENDLQTAFTYPTPVETNLQSSPITVPSSRTSVPQIEITVTSDMLLANAGGDVGHKTGMQVQTLLRWGSGSGTIFVECGLLVAATGIEFTSASSGFNGPSTTNIRGTAFVNTPPIAVGDKVRLRIWCGSGQVIYMDWWARRSFVTRIGSKLDGSGRVGLMRDVVETGTMGGFTPTTTLTLGANGTANTWVYTSDSTREQWLDRGVLMSQNVIPSSSRTILGDPTLGVMTMTDGVSGTNYAGGVASTNAQVYGLNAATQWRMDRLFVPASPN